MPTLAIRPELVILEQDTRHPTPAILDTPNTLKQTYFISKAAVVKPHGYSKLTRTEFIYLHCTVRPTTGLFRTVEPNSPRTVYGLPLYRFDSFYIVYMVPNTIFHHAKVLPLGFLGAYGLPDAP